MFTVCYGFWLLWVCLIDSGRSLFWWFCGLLVRLVSVNLWFRGFLLFVGDLYCGGLCWLLWVVGSIFGGFSGLDS